MIYYQNGGILRKKTFITTTLFVTLAIFLILFFYSSTNLIAIEPQPNPIPADIILLPELDKSKISTDLLAVYGPQICTAFGDAFSPWLSIYEPNSYTYTYRIKIPSDYAHDTVRVELFDPDSINNSANEATISRTAIVQDAAAVDPALGSNIVKFCGVHDSSSPQQVQSCSLSTDELNYLGTPLTLQQINPYWFMRVDLNRGHGTTGNGDGTCGFSGIYETRFNTRTSYALYYYKTAVSGDPTRSTLASYTGQAGDDRDLTTGATAAGDHNTDLNWVSPGATNQGSDFDSLYGTNHVPVDPGSTAESFEIHLTDDTLNMVVDAETGVRYLYVDITALSGASENAFAIWAGPTAYAATTPANINQRNILVTNNPSAHASGGIIVTAVHRAVFSSIFDDPIERPLIHLSPDMQGGVVTLSIFDSDVGSEPPITFYIDTIPEEDWSLTFGTPGEADPDGIASGIRCLPGSCSDQWIDPAYQIKIPESLEVCPSFATFTGGCTPFSGGTLMIRYDIGSFDASTWEITQIPADNDPPPELTTTVDGSGTISRSEEAPYALGQTLDLTAVPDPNWEFSHWSGDVSGSTNPKMITLNDDMTVTAVFTPIIVNLTTSTVGDGTVTASLAGPYQQGQQITLTATADPGWVFVGWSGDITNSTNPLPVTFSGDLTIQAEFELDSTAIITEYTIFLPLIANTPTCRKDGCKDQSIR